MEFDEKKKWDNNTFGLRAKGSLGGIALYGEVAYQDQAGLAGDDEAYYAHVTATKTFGTQSVVLGLENLGQGFKTPLATVHAFNGFADGTDPGRISGAQNGLTDLYLGYTDSANWGAYMGYAANAELLNCTGGTATGGD